MAGQTEAKAGQELKAGGERGEWRRLWTLVLLLVLVAAAGWRFVGFAQDPQFQVHSDDLLWMWRFVNTPRATAPRPHVDYSQMAYLPGPPEIRKVLNYVSGIDQGALERWVFHYLLLASGKMPESLPEKTWDYTQDMKWNIDQGNVAPPDAVHFVRVVNAAFMIGAVILVYIALARSVTPMAGFAGGLYLVLHSSMVDVLWSIGSDPLLWFCMALVLLLWVVMGGTFWAAVVVGIAGGLAASAKLNGAFVLVAYLVWLAVKRKPLLALLSGAVGLGVFIILDPIVFAKGVLGVPGMLVEMVKWRAARAHLMALHYPAFADAPRWYVYFYLLGPWWALVPLLVAARRLWRLDAAVFWGLALLVGHLLTVTAPLPRYTLPLQAGLVLGLIAAYWPKRVAAVRGIGRLFGRGRQAA
jgi:hypothetical protein